MMDMGRNLILILCYLFTNGAWCQFGQQQIISNQLNDPYIAAPLDFDGNGTIDILAATANPYLIGFFSNLDGEGTFGEFNPLENNAGLNLQFFFEDIDTDGDKDLMFLINNPKELVWYENLDGLGTFGPKQIIIENFPDYLMSVEPADTDNDGDLDLIAQIMDSFNYWLVLFENINGTPNYAEPIILIEDPLMTFIKQPEMVDLDNDGYLDMLTSYENLNGPAHLVWYRNSGNNTFEEEREIYRYNFSASDNTSIYVISHVDINSDGMKDIAIVASNDDLGTSYKWFENLDNTGNFSDILSLSHFGIYSDVDANGDIDIVKGNYLENRIYWVENMGGGNFGNERDVTTEINFLRYVGTADLNGDGFIDITSASLEDNKIAWYENSGLLDNHTIESNIIQLAPNPAKSQIVLSEPLNLSAVFAYSTQGIVMQLSWEDQVIDVSVLPDGFYVLHLITADGRKHILKLLRE